jgi:S1-C subfamily serine protease
MAFTLQTLNDQHITVDADVAVIGTDPSCNVVADDNRLKRRHAVIKKVTGKWMIQSEGDWLLRVGNGMPGRKCWLNPGDTIWLAEGGPAFVFSPQIPPALSPAPQALVVAATDNRAEVRTANPPALPVPIGGRSPVVAQEHPVAELRRTGSAFGKSLVATGSSFAGPLRKHRRLILGVSGSILAIILLFIFLKAPLGRWIPFLGSGSVVSSVDNDQVIAETTGLIVCGYHIILQDGTKVEIPETTGTGFAVSPDGYILTNKHVVEEIANRMNAKLLLARLRKEKLIEVTPQIWVFFGQKHKYVADVVHVSENYDLAILKIGRQGGAYYRLSTTDALRRGMRVYALGFPGAARTALSEAEIDEQARRHKSGTSIQAEFKNRDFEFILTTGAISRVTSESEGRHWVQHNADINPGNSGGPLAREDGVVIGINTMKVTDASGVYYSLAVPQLREEIDQHVKSARWE